jgi:hypothetical protein
MKPDIGSSQIHTSILRAAGSVPTCTCKCNGVPAFNPVLDESGSMFRSGLVHGKETVEREIGLAYFIFTCDASVEFVPLSVCC